MTNEKIEQEQLFEVKKAPKSQKSGKKKSKSA